MLVFDEAGLKQQKRGDQRYEQGTTFIGYCRPCNSRLSEAPWVYSLIWWQATATANYLHYVLPALLEWELLVPLVSKGPELILNAIGEDKGMMVAVNSPSR